MKSPKHKSVLSFCIMLIFPLLMGCSTFGGSGSVSSDPAVAEQQREVDQLKKELREAERFAEEANQREKAAKDRLKAAEHELKALEERAKRRSEY
ncbi:hypothetical protein [Pontibacter cellulosilyticus]|uniref:Uncharacterized protein n=1 Tax=Pontibacter cellulosilyticus TaxID=1720253 RepID=A0A923N7F7_9BACT|nr:hypothetical protein [Pontibacter cellulosilyticus]MBC5992282.1 hypothetical protein [Pontibacter cellulosilyticus]